MAPIDPESIDLSTISYTEAQLFPFQKDGVRFGLARNGRVLLADDMGIGVLYINLTQLCKQQLFS
jgi:hypothetical protein